jgi:hypothetical protein
VQDYLIEDATIAVSSRAALNAINFVAPLSFDPIYNGYSYNACLFDNAAGWDVWLYTSAGFVCRPPIARNISLLLTLGKAGPFIPDGGVTQSIAFPNLSVPCVSESFTLTHTRLVGVTPPFFGSVPACNVYQDRRWHRAFSSSQAVGRNNVFDVTLELTWIAANPLP